MIRLLLISLTVCSSTVASLAAEPAAPTENAQQSIARAVAELGDARYAVRDRAMAYLWKIGLPAQPALKRAAASGDAEVASRARALLERFQYGIFADTPAEVVQLVNRFRFGNASDQWLVSQKLIEQGQLDTLIVLIRNLPNDATRGRLIPSIARQAAKSIPQLIEKQRLPALEKLLRLTAMSEQGAPNYVAFLVLQNKLDDRLRALQDRLAGGGEGNAALAKHDFRLLALMLRARGDLDAALQAAERADDIELRAGILLENQRFGELARLLPEHAAVLFPQTEEALGYQIAIYHRAGMAQQAERFVKEFKQMTVHSASSRFHCAEALLVSDRFDEAIEILERHNRASAFDLLVSQRRYRRGLALYGLDLGNADYSAWLRREFQTAQATAGSTSQRRTLTRQVVQSAVRIAKLLYRLGNSSQAESLLARAAEHVADDDPATLATICEAEAELGLREQVLKHAALAIQRNPSYGVWKPVFGDHSGSAQVLYMALKRIRPKADDVSRLKQLQALLSPSARGGNAGEASPVQNGTKTGGPPDWRELVESVKHVAAGLKAPAPAKWLAALAELALVQGDRKLGVALLEQSAEIESSNLAAIRLAEELAKDKRWAESAQWRHTAWQKAPDKAIQLYLSGHALEKAGEKKAGQERQRAAILAPLGDATQRYYLAKGLYDSGHQEEAARQWRLVLRTGPPGSWGVNNSALRLGNVVSESDPARAADLWEQILISCLRRYTSMVDTTSYLRISYLVHKSRGRGLLKAGRAQAALEEFMAARAAQPAHSQLVLDIVPLLDKAGHKPLGDKLFAAVHAELERLCREHPKIAMHRNNLAWMAARTGRRLGEALSYARSAVGLAPRSAAYRDTLAEVHFRRGEVEDAVREIRKAIELEPQTEYFKEQLARFQKEKAE